MNETQRRIKAYQDALPGIRERIVAVALLLAMSFMMVVSTSFAWLTISRAPAVMGVNTTVAANGSLEIALATGDGKTAPGDSKVGDSFAREGQTVFASNQTWGNLINLGDPAYGLDKMTLRPASLNTAGLKDSPLSAAVYKQNSDTFVDADGRVMGVTSEFGYAVGEEPTPDNPEGFFRVSDQVGVRAIAAITPDTTGAENRLYKLITAVKDANGTAGSAYANLAGNTTYMQSLATMMGLYMTARMNPDEASLNNPDCAAADIQNLRDMYAAFLGAFDQEAEAVAALANLQLFLMHGEGNYTPYTKEMIYATTTNKLKAEGIQITRLDEFIKDRNTIVSDLEKLKTISSSGTSLKWADSGLNAIVNNLVNVGACTIGADNTPISSIGASNAMGYLSGTQEARITNGILYRFEERVGAYIAVKNLSISAKVKRMGITAPATVKANVQTTAPRDYNLFGNDLKYAESLNDGSYAKPDMIASDTYGLAVDLWVRTNSSGSYLTLEGNVITESEMVRSMGTDANGNEVELYTVTISGTSEEPGYALTVYPGMVTKTDEQGNQWDEMGWLNSVSHTALSDEELGGQEPLEKYEEKVTVIGYEGENRIWDASKQLSSDATTQGSGSCYIYYADTPEDQARSLSLLKAFKVAFVGYINGEAKKLCTAEMDTEHYYAQSGRVIVPLVLSTSDSINLGEDYTGQVTYAITALEHNAPTRITALVYLDGDMLTNDSVLSAADIQGQLNIQFGSNKSLQPIGNEKLEGEYRSVSASVSETKFNYDTHVGDMKTTVTVSVDGDEPGTVTAFFLREISATQGSREETMTFSKNAAGQWVADYVFKNPGNYILRSVRLDGVDYDLASPPKVEIEGFTVASLSCEQAVNNHISVMTAAASSPVDVRLKFATNDASKMPRTVQGRFLRDDGSATNINFSYNPTTGFWTGSAAFLSSGRYSLQYLVLDDDYVELDENLWQTATVYLGMKAKVYTTSPHSIKYIPSEMADNQKLLGMQVMIEDDTGSPMPGLSDVKLTYGMKGSGTRKMDADLRWNGSYYVGEMPNGGPGVWQFSHVTVGSNTITTATTFPTFTILSPEPPAYYEHRTSPYQFAVNTEAVMNVQITNSAAAVVQAQIVKEDGTQTWVDGLIGTDFVTEDGKPCNNWNFVVPEDGGYQDGNWQLMQLKLWNVFDKDGKEYTEQEPLLIDVSGSNNKTKVVSRILVSFSEDKSQNFGKDAAGKVTGAFMDSYEVSGLAVNICDFEGRPITGIKNVKVTFGHQGNSAAYGGYTGGPASSDITIELKDDGSGTRFAQTGTQVFRQAGSYKTTFSYVVSVSGLGDTTVSYSGDDLPSNAPTFTVSSVAPSVAITGISPTGTFDVDSTGIGSGHKSATVPVWTATNATVYFKCARSGSGSTCDPYRHNYTRPSVSMTLSGIGNASNATISFGSGVHIYNGTTQTDGYSWTGNGTCSRNIGYFRSRSAANDDKTAAGTLSSGILTLAYSNSTYTVEIPTITINNPY